MNNTNMPTANSTSSVIHICYQLHGRINASKAHSNRAVLPRLYDVVWLCIHTAKRLKDKSNINEVFQNRQWKAQLHSDKWLDAKYPLHNVENTYGVLPLYNYTTVKHIYVIRYSSCTSCYINLVPILHLPKTKELSKISPEFAAHVIINKDIYGRVYGF